MAPTNNRLNPNAPTRSATQNLVQVLDTFVAPERDRMREQALAQGFNAMGQTLGNYSRRELSRELTETANQAQADALGGLDPSEEFAQVRMGNIFRPHSRAYMDAYNATQGRVAAIEFRDSTTLAYAQSGLDRNTDPEAFRAWYNERLQGFLSQNDNPYFMAGAMPLVEQATFNLSAQHTGNIVRTMEANRAAAARRLAAEATLNTMGEFNRLEGNIEAAIAEGRPEEVDTIRYQQSLLLGQAISGVNSDFYATGDAGPVFRGATVEGALDYAEATGNMGVLRGIQQAAQMGALRLTPQEMLNVRNRAESIQDNYDEEIRRQEAQAQRARVAEERFVTDTIADIAMNPANFGMTAQQLLEATPELQDLILNSDNTAALMDSLTNTWNAISGGHEVPPEIAEGYETEFRDAITNGEITDRHTAMAWITQRDAEGYRFTDDNISTMMDIATDLAQPDNNLSDPLTGQAIRAAIQQARTQLIAPETLRTSMLDDTGNSSDFWANRVSAVVTEYIQDRIGTLDLSSRDAATQLAALQAEAISAAHLMLQTENPEAYMERFENVMSNPGAAASEGIDLNNPSRIVSATPDFEQFRLDLLGAVAVEEAALTAAGLETLGVNPDGSPVATTTEPAAEPTAEPTAAPAEEPGVTIRLSTTPPSTEDMVMPFDTFAGMDEAPAPEATPTAEDELAQYTVTLSQYEDVVANGGSIYDSDIIELQRAILALPASMVPSEIRQRVVALQRSNNR